MKRLAVLILIGLLLAAGPPLAAAGILCHTDTVVQGGCCCAHPQPASSCRMGCAESPDGQRVPAPLAASPRGEHSTAVSPSTVHPSAMADAPASRPMRNARAPDSALETLYLLDRTLRC